MLTPRNIRRLKKEIKKNAVEGIKDTSQGKAESKKKVELEKRTSDLLEDNTPKRKLSRTDILSEHKESAEEDDIEEFLEGMEDPFHKDWKEIEVQRKKMSNYSTFKTYSLRSVIFKSNKELRQELLAIQLIKRLKKIFDEANLSLFLRPYEIIITSHSSGFIE